MYHVLCVNNSTVALYMYKNFNLKIVMLRPQFTASEN